MLLDWVHERTIWVGLTIVCALFAVPAVIGSYLLQPSVARLFRREKDVNSVLGFVLNAHAVYFGVLLALLSISVFENHNRAQDALDREAASLVRLVRDLRAYPEPLRAELFERLRAYVEDEIGPGWTDQRRGHASAREVELINNLHRKLTSYEPIKQSEALIHAQALQTLSAFIEDRRLRIAQGAARVPRILWIVVLFGAVVNIALLWAFDMARGSHAIVSGTLALFIGAIIYMIAILDEPYRGRYGLKPQAMMEA